MNLSAMYREIEALGGAPIMDDYDEGYTDGLNDALAVLRKFGFGLDMAPASIASAEKNVLAIRNAAHLCRLISERPTDRHSLVYTNYRGETSTRELHLVRLWYGETTWHPQAQLLLRAFDYEKDAYRDFAVADFSFCDHAKRSKHADTTTN